MAAKDKSDLLAVTAKEFEKLDALIRAIAAPTAERKDADDTSVKDVVAHRAHWIDLFLGWHADGLAEKPVYFPAKGYKWNDLKRYNADLRARQADWDWSAAVAALRKSHNRLVAFIETQTDADLYGGPMKGAKNDWPTGRWAEAAGASHFRSAAKYLRAARKADAQGAPRPQGSSA